MTMSDEDSIRPVIDVEDEPFWQAAHDHELRMQQCNECGNLWWAPASICPECWAGDYDWVELSGEGTVNSWVIFHRPYWEEFEDEIPYNVAEIELAEGPRYLANIVECENDDIYRGMPVEVVFDTITEEVKLPKFKPQ